MKLVCFKQKEKYYITENVEGRSYHSSEINHSITFNDGLVAEKTFKEHFFSLPELPVKATKKERDQKVFKQYRIKAGYPISELTPETLSSIDEDSEIIGLYTPEYDTIEGGYVNVELEVEYLGETTNILIDKPKYPMSRFIIDQINTHPVLHDELPCFINGKQLYVVVREFIKKNIDPKYARITSDYDFCLTVSKVIAHEPIEKQGTRQVSKRKTVPYNYYVRERLVKCFETSPEGYSNYPKMQGITAKSAVELEKEVDKYCQDLIDMINEPLKECPHCSGRGVVVN
jgi:hypothetical protein